MSFWSVCGYHSVESNGTATSYDFSRDIPKVEVVATVILWTLKFLLVSYLFSCKFFFFFEHWYIKACVFILVN